MMALHTNDVLVHIAYAKQFQLTNVSSFEKKIEEPSHYTVH